MPLNISSIVYVKGDEIFEVDEIEITNRTFHHEQGNYKEPDDDIETIVFKAETQHGIITGEATARRSGFDSDFEPESVEVSIDTDDTTIEISEPRLIMEIDEGED